MCEDKQGVGCGARSTLTPRQSRTHRCQYVVCPLRPPISIVVAHDTGQSLSHVQTPKHVVACTENSSQLSLDDGHWWGNRNGHPQWAEKRRRGGPPYQVLLSVSLGEVHVGQSEHAGSTWITRVRILDADGRPLPIRSLVRLQS